MAPQGMPTGGATGVLPSLTDGAQAGAGTGAGIPTAATAAQGQTAAAGAEPGTQAPAAPAAGKLDITSLASQGRWFGPIMAIGGGVAALAAFSRGQDGSKFLKFGGVSAALGGMALTGVGFKAKGIDTGKQATQAEAVQAMTQLQQHYETTMQNIAAQASTEIGGLRQQLAARQPTAADAATPADATTAVGPATAAGEPAPGTPAAEQGTSPGAATPGDVLRNPDGTPRTDVPLVDGATPGVGIGLNTTVVPTSSADPVPATGATRAMLGTTVQLPAGTSATGATIADAGNYRLEQVAGDANGYATLEEANAAARTTMNTEHWGSSFLRWMVIEQGGRFYGVVAKKVPAREPAKPLPATAGSVVAWSAMHHVGDNGRSGWQVFSWTKSGGAEAIAVPYGAGAVFAATPAGTAADAAGSATGTAPVAGGGAVRTASFDPASQVGRSFPINASTTPEGDLARGGFLQLQRFVDSSTGGFGTPEEAATAARAARAAAGGGDQWKRWVTVQGSDGRYYVYEGSIVKRQTAPLQGGAAMHVFGAGFAEYFDGSTSSWRALRDTAG